MTVKKAKAESAKTRTRAEACDALEERESEHEVFYEELPRGRK